MNRSTRDHDHLTRLQLIRQQNERILKGYIQMGEMTQRRFLQRRPTVPLRTRERSLPRMGSDIATPLNPSPPIPTLSPLNIPPASPSRLHREEKLVSFTPSIVRSSPNSIVEIPEEEEPEEEPEEEEEEIFEELEGDVGDWEDNYPLEELLQRLVTVGPLGLTSALTSFFGESSTSSTPSSTSSSSSSSQAIPHGHEKLGGIVVPCGIPNEKKLPENPDPNTKVCAICFEREVSTMFLECLHCVGCVTCSRHLVQAANRTPICPLCRKNITRIVKWFA